MPQAPGLNAARTRRAAAVSRRRGPASRSQVGPQGPTAREGGNVKWSVGIEAEGDRVLSREEVVELADAVAASDGVASGVGSRRYGARLIVQAGSRNEAVEKAKQEFTRAVAKAGLPVSPIARVEAVSEDEDAAG